MQRRIGLILIGAARRFVGHRGSGHRRQLPSQRRRGNHPDGELAAGQHGHLSRAGQVEGDPAAHHRHDDLQQGDQRRPRHHRPDRRPRRERHAAADQGARARQRDRVGGRQRRADSHRRQPVLLQERWRPAQHAHRPAVELGPSRHQPAHARPALLGQGDAERIARAAARSAAICGPATGRGHHTWP